MQGRRVLGWVGPVAGGILLLIGASWGHAGHDLSQTPMLLLLVFGGGAVAVVGGLSLRTPKLDAGSVDWHPPTDDSEQQCLGR